MRHGSSRRFAVTVITALVVASSLAAAGGVAAGSTIPKADSGSPASNVAPAACTPGQSACPIPIRFAPGAYSGQASSTMTGINSVRWFSVRARAGQVMVVVVKGDGPTRGIVYFPNGGYDGQPGGRVFDGPLPASGEYRIRVTESSMAEAWQGRVTVVVMIY